MTRADREAYYVMLSESLTRKARTDLLSFTVATMPNFDPAEFHRRYYARLTDFARGDIDRLMVFVPPQHGKSEGSTRRLPAFVLGQNPDTKIAIVSYSATKARKFNREIQRIIDTEEYRRIFPATSLNSTNVTTVARAWVRPLPGQGSLAGSISRQPANLAGFLCWGVSSKYTLSAASPPGVNECV